MVIGESLNRCIANYGDKVAVRDYYGKYFPEGFSYTYRELGQAVNRLASSLLKAGLRKGDRVAVQTGSGAACALSLFALLKVGIGVVPVDRTFTGDEIAYQVGDSGARAMIVDADIYESRVKPVESRLSTVEFFIGVGDPKACTYDLMTLADQGDPAEPGIEVSEDDIATLIYTSGTTGRPKGAPLTHRNWTFSAYMWAAELGIHPYTRWLMVLPLHTSGGTGLTIASVTRGCSLSLCNPDPKKMIDVINKEKISFIQFSPTLLANLVRHPDIGNCDFSHIEHWFTSAAPISAELLSEGAKYLGPTFIQLYGTTETALLGTVLRPEEVSVTGPFARRLTSIGRACLGYQTKVIDDDGNEVGPGGTGELLVRGGGVAGGYWNKPEATDFKDGWWYSGDVVQIDEDGYYYVVDRKKDMILTGGLNVYPREVETVISAHAAVNIVSVVGVPDEKWGESVKAVIVLKAGASATEDDIMEWCRERLAPYKKPKSVDFIDISEMPMMGGGYKVLRRELRDRYRKKFEEEKKKKVDRWGLV